MRVVKQRLREEAERAVEEKRESEREPEEEAEIVNCTSREQERTKRKPEC